MMTRGEAMELVIDWQCKYEVVLNIYQRNRLASLIQETYENGESAVTGEAVEYSCCQFCGVDLNVQAHQSDCAMFKSFILPES